MTLSRKLIFLMFVFFQVNWAFAKSCSMSGQWTFSDGLYPPFVLSQQDTIVTIVNPAIHPLCGAMKISGKASGDKFSLDWYMENQDAYEFCKNSIHYEGEFLNKDCTIVSGVMRSHLGVGDLQDIVGTFKWYRPMIVITDPVVLQKLVIDATPKMPPISAQAKLIRPDLAAMIRRNAVFDPNLAPFTWHLSISGNESIFFYDAELPEWYENAGYFQPDFSLLKDKEFYSAGDVMGGALTIKVEHFKGASDEKTFIVEGTNPGRGAVESFVKDKLIRQIICQESHYRQFKAPPEGGVGIPLVGRDENYEETGGLGMMQVFDPDPNIKQAWNWKENILAGIEIFNSKLKEAKESHINTRKRLNGRRKKIGAALCPEESFIPLNDEQIRYDAIRRYNGGVEYKWKVRDSTNCQGEWLRYHVRLKGADKDYINNVLQCQ